MARKPTIRVLPDTPIFDSVVKEFGDPRETYEYAHVPLSASPRDVAKVVKAKAKRRQPVSVT